MSVNKMAFPPKEWVGIPRRGRGRAPDPQRTAGWAHGQGHVYRKSPLLLGYSCISCGDYKPINVFDRARILYDG